MNMRKVGMKSITTYRRLEPNTLGEQIQLIQTFSSQDKAEIDHLETMFKKSIKDYSITEFDYDYKK